MAKSFVVFFVFRLSLGHFLNEIHKRIFLSSTPNLRTQNFPLMAAFISFNGGISCEKIGELSQDRDDSVEV